MILPILNTLTRFADGKCVSIDPFDAELYRDREDLRVRAMGHDVPVPLTDEQRRIVHAAQADGYVFPVRVKGLPVKLRLRAEPRLRVRCGSPARNVIAAEFYAPRPVCEPLSVVLRAWKGNRAIDRIEFDGRLKAIDSTGESWDITHLLEGR